MYTFGPVSKYCPLRRINIQFIKLWQIENLRHDIILHNTNSAGKFLIKNVDNFKSLQRANGPIWKTMHVYSWLKKSHEHLVGIFSFTSCDSFFFYIFSANILLHYFCLYVIFNLYYNDDSKLPIFLLFDTTMTIDS